MDSFHEAILPLADEIIKLRRENAKLTEFCNTMEYCINRSDGNGNRCPFCNGSVMDGGHKNNCWMARCREKAGLDVKWEV